MLLTDGDGRQRRRQRAVNGPFDVTSATLCKTMGCRWNDQTIYAFVHIESEISLSEPSESLSAYASAGECTGQRVATTEVQSEAVNREMTYKFRNHNLVNSL